MRHITAVVEHMEGAERLPWRYCLVIEATGETWAGQVNTRDEAWACVDAYLRGFWRRAAIRPDLERALADTEPPPKRP